MESCGTSQKCRQHKGVFPDLSELLGYYPPLGYSEEVFEIVRVQPVLPNQEFTLVPSQKVLGLPQIGHVLPRELG